MPTITLTEIVSGLDGSDIFLVDTDNGRGTDYTSIENALNSEGSAGLFFVAPGTYNPGSSLSPSADQEIVGIGNPTISGTTINLPNNNCRLSGFKLTGSKSSNVSDTTVSVGGNSCRLEKLVVENRRIEVNGNRVRVSDCEVLGNITNSYSSPANYDEIEALGNFESVDNCYVEGSITGTYIGTNHTN